MLRHRRRTLLAVSAALTIPLLAGCGPAITFGEGEQQTSTETPAAELDVAAMEAALMAAIRLPSEEGFQEDYPTTGLVDPEGADLPTFGSEFLDAEGTPFDISRVGRAGLGYSTDEWVDGGSPQFYLWLEAVNFGSTAKANEVVGAFRNTTNERSEPIPPAEGGHGTTEYLPEAENPLADIPAGAVQRGIIINWSNDTYTHGVIVYVPYEEYVFIAYGVATADGASQDALAEFFEEELPPMYERVRQAAAAEYVLAG